MRSTDEALRRGMHFPTQWDSFVNDYMTLADVYRYPGQHFDCTVLASRPHRLLGRLTCYRAMRPDPHERPRFV